MMEFLQDLIVSMGASSRPERTYGSHGSVSYFQWVQNILGIQNQNTKRMRIRKSLIRFFPY